MVADFLPRHIVARLPKVDWIALSLAGNYAFVGAVLVAAIVVASDWFPSANSFWREHQAVSSLATGAVLILVAITGLDRIIANREARRWRPLAVMIIDQLKRSQWNIDSSLFARTLDYCGRAYGESEIPADRHFFSVLIEALEDPETWAATDSSGEYPDLIEELAEDLARSEEHLEVWAPLLNANSQLADIGAVAVARQTAGEGVLRELAMPDVFMRLGKTTSVIREKSVRIVVGLIHYRRAVEEFASVTDRFGRT
jgi:hypothetical protein